MRFAFLAMLIAAALVAAVSSASTGSDLQVVASPRTALEARLQALEPQLRRLANNTPGLVAITVSDAQGQTPIDINGDENLPAASVIKLAVMVEVMRQVWLGRFGLERQVTLLPQDRDCGYGALCDRDAGMRFSVLNLVRIMIANSDNTATNMLIRLVGRQNINATMNGLGLTQTRLGDSIHASDRSIRTLRTSTNDMMRLLSMIAARRLVNETASDLMLSILAGQRHNDLLPKPLPKGVVVEHKTGTLHDTLNDVGIVNLEGSPYIICVITTHLDDLDDGARFIRRASRATYDAFLAAETDAAIQAQPTSTPDDLPASPDPSPSI
ncbi:MAG TPA: serine hydrolase [Candidatus Eremiobacteraceae bacterium]|nr:serine hydrolase [Candidatus Eremiobacteraceae bacterium]